MDTRVKPAYDEICCGSSLVSHRARLLRVVPRCLGEWHGALWGFQGLGVGGGAVADAAGDTLGDAGEPEQVIGEIPVQVGNGAAGDVAIDLRRLVHARNV